MGLSRTRFTREFKLAAMQRLEQGISIAEVARAWAVNPNVLHRWCGEFRQGRALCSEQRPISYLVVSPQGASAKYPLLD
jgi:transposase-like protein